jgi:hypothetical protein
MLVQTNTGQTAQAVPFSTMTSAEQLTDGRWQITTRDGETRVFSDNDWKIAIATPNVTLAAFPGTYVVAPNEDGDKPPYWKSNVLGWGISLDGIVRPIVVDPHGLADDWTVLHPDGRVETGKGDEFDDVAAWLAMAGPRP